MSVTARQIITRAFSKLGVYAPGDSIPSANMNDGLTDLNMMISGWGQQPYTIPAISIEDFDLVSGKGGPSDPYLIGDGATGDDFDTQKPSNQDSIVGAAILLGGTSPVVEIGRAMLTDDQYEAIQIKEMGNPLFTDVWYNPTYSTGFGAIYLWPVPNVDTNDIRLYIQQSIAQFTNLSTSYIFPDGYEEALVYQLCLRLAPTYRQPITPEVRELAVKAFANIKRSNVKLTDVPQDFPQVINSNNRYGYNIQTGNQ